MIQDDSWFMARVTIDRSGCWLWSGYLRADGYGQLKRGGKWFKAHRYAYEQTHGAINAGLVVHHHCYVRHCVNPEHLEVRTRRDNTLDEGSGSVTRLHVEQTHCKRGHEFTDENTYRYRTSRICRRCRAMQSKARRQL